MVGTRASWNTPNTPPLDAARYAPTLFVGLGSPHGDDQIGWRIAEGLAAAPPDGVLVRKAASAADLFDWLDGICRLRICDACRGVGEVGRLFRWTWPDVPAPLLRNAGSHDLALPAVLETARRLGRLPDRVEILGVEVRHCEPGASLSPDLEAALPRLIAAARET